MTKPRKILQNQTFAPSKVNSAPTSTDYQHSIAMNTPNTPTPSGEDHKTNMSKSLQLHEPSLDPRSSQVNVVAQDNQGDLGATEGDSYPSSPTSTQPQTTTSVPPKPPVSRIYNLVIHPFEILQGQYAPFFPNSYAFNVHTLTDLHRDHTRYQTNALWVTMIQSMIVTFYARLRCSLCLQTPFFEPETPLVNANHHLPRNALLLWRALKRDIENQDVVLLQQEHVDYYFRRLIEIERMYYEGGEAAVGCCVQSWNGWRPSIG